MTALQLCQRCGEGLTVHRDGEPCPRCSNCGAPETCPFRAPLVAGGEGRSAQEVKESSLIAGVCLAAVALLVLAAWLVQVLR